MKRVRYNRADIKDTMRVAIDLARRNQYPMFVHASALGYTIAQCPPPFNQDYYKIRPDGDSILIRREFIGR